MDELIKRLRNRRICIQQSGSLDDFPLLAEAADAIEELSKPRWIPVTERLPEEMNQSCGGWSAEIRPSDDVLVWLSHEKRQSVAWYSHTYNEWTTVDENTVYCFGEVTHWMPLPQAPKEEV